MDASQGDVPNAPRKLSRAARRVQLIEATIEVLAERGYARTTLSDVANRAGLSHGLVNFHFQSKDLLLAETLSHLAEEYRQTWVAALAGAGAGAAERLDALLRATFAPTIFTPSRLAAWVAFWGEAQSRPLYQARCGMNDDDYAAQMELNCAALVAETGGGRDPARIARALRLVAEGVWMDLVIMARPYSRQEGLATVHCAAAAFFPQHFGPEGVVAAPEGAISAANSCSPP